MKRGPAGNLSVQPAGDWVTNDRDTSILFAVITAANWAVNHKFSKHFFVCLQVSQQQIEQSIKEMLEQKNKLAYDKGKLETKVEQLQREMENLATAQVDLAQLRKLHNATEAKLNKVCWLF